MHCGDGERMTRRNGVSKEGAREKRLTSLTMLSLGTSFWIYARVKVTVVDALWYAVPYARTRCVPRLPRKGSRGKKERRQQRF